MMRLRPLVGVLALLCAAPASAAVRVALYHTNDIHGWIMSRPDSNGRSIGGAPALAAVLKREKSPRLLLDGGDWWQGTPEGTLTKGAAMAEIFNELGYDAVTVGNHEFDAGVDSLRNLVALIKVPVLSANIHDAASDRPVGWVKPWILKDVAGVRFGIFGLTTTDMKRLSFPENIAGLKFRREIDAAKEAVQALREQGAQVIVAVTHVGVRREGHAPFEDDLALAREVAGIDIVVGGHSHTELRPAVLESTHGTLIVQAGSYLTHVGRVELEIEGGRLVSKRAELLPLSPDEGADERIQAVIDRHAEVVGRAFDVVVATATAAMTRGQSGESALGSWMADCYRHEAKTEVAVQNGGGIRADLQKGPVTVRHLFNVMPFDNHLINLRMRGSDLRAILDHGVGHRRTGQFSGVEVEYRPGVPAGKRILSAKVGKEPLLDGKEYLVTAVNFIVAGGDHYPGFGSALETQPLGLLARDALLSCARRQKKIGPPKPGRLKPVASPN